LSLALALCLHTSACVSISQHTSAYVTNWRRASHLLCTRVSAYYGETLTCNSYTLVNWHRHARGSKFGTNYTLLRQGCLRFLLTLIHRPIPTPSLPGPVFFLFFSSFFFTRVLTVGLVVQRSHAAPVLIPLYIYVSPYYYICVLILLYVSSYYYICPHTTICVSTYYYICVLILLYMCPHTTTCVSPYYYMCPHTTVYMSLYFYMRVLTVALLLYYRSICYSLQ